MGRVHHTQSFTLTESVERVFPLMSPEGEKLWVPGWDYRNLSGSTDLHEDFIFVTENHDHSAVEAIWMVKRYDQLMHRIELYRVEPGVKVGHVDIQCTATDDGGCLVEASYAYTALSEQGDAFVANFDAQAYSTFIAEWKSLLERYFEEGPVNE